MAGTPPDKQTPQFPKPAPADAPPLARWLAKRRDRAEVGREPFFEGRDAEYAVFQETVGELAMGEVGGATLVFAGAPGAGKTALMQEMMQAVRLQSSETEPWVAVELKAGDLLFSGRAVKKIADAACQDEAFRKRSADGVDTLTKLSQNLSGAVEKIKAFGEEALDRGVRVLGTGVGPKMPPVDISPEDVFQSAGAALAGTRVVVFLDEAQNLDAADRETREIVDMLHRGLTGIDMLPVFFGLSDTPDRLAECGVSRLGLGQINELRPMSSAESKAVFVRLFTAYNLGAPALRDGWAEQLAEESQGWPQHIRGLSVATGKAVAANSGKLNEDAMRQAVIEGRKIKGQYYGARLRAAVSEAGLYKRIALTMAETQRDVLSRDEIKGLTEPTLGRLNMTLPDFLSVSLHAGILSPSTIDATSFRFPIPSLAQYLREKPDVNPAGDSPGCAGAGAGRESGASPP